MKMHPEDFAKLEKAVGPLSRSTPRKDTMSPAAHRWTLFHLANPRPNLPFRYLHDYLNDSHIDTALRRIVKNHPYQER